MWLGDCVRRLANVELCVVTGRASDRVSMLPQAFVSVLNSTDRPVGVSFVSVTSRCRQALLILARNHLYILDTID